VLVRNVLIQIGAFLTMYTICWWLDVQPRYRFIIGFLFVLWQMLLFILVNTHSTSRDVSYGLSVLNEIDDHTLLLEKHEATLFDWVLRYQYDRIYGDFWTQLRQLTFGSFTVTTNDVPDLCIQLAGRDGARAFTTIVLDETRRFPQTDAEGQFLECCREKGKKIGRNFTEVFIIRDNISVTQEVYELMEKHHHAGMNVVVVTADEVRRAGNEPDVELGIWDQRHVTIMKKYTSESGTHRVTEVHVDTSRVAEDVRKSDNYLSAGALDYNRFKEKMCEPINTRPWTILLAENSALARALEPSARDVENMWSWATTQVDDPRRVLVLGRTTSIIDYLSEVYLTNKTGDGVETKRVDILKPAVDEPTVDILDGAAYGSRLSSNIVVHPGNWLTWSNPDGVTRYDVIMGDDPINDLGLWQYHLFFRNMASLLNPKGVLVMRAIAKYREPATALPQFESVVAELDAIGGSLIPPMMIYLRLIPMFHGKDFYDPRGCCFDLSEWNRMLSVRHANLIEKLTFPVTVKVTSVPLVKLQEYSDSWFSLGELRATDSEYLGHNEGTEDFYRILPFAKKEPCGE